ncbi:MAG: cytochrome P460 family protein [Cyanobacteria bacterium P01_D01_bin.36]
MNRFRRMTWVILLVGAIAVAITLNHFLSPHSLQSSNSRYPSNAIAASNANNPHDTPYVSEPYEPAVAETEASFQVEFPADYRERFVQYVTVDCPSSRIVRKMFVNPQALTALQTNSTPPSGTVLVMETHSARPSSSGRLMPARLNNAFVREKRNNWQNTEDSGEWRSAWYSPEGTLVSNSQESCMSCHAMVRDRDYLFTLPALLNAARTGQKQHQETEFGTAVCR